MHMGDAVYLGLSILGAAWIMRIQGPLAGLNIVAWVCAVLVTIAVGRLVFG